MSNGKIAVVGTARVGAARVGYHPGGLLCQVGRRLSPARVGVARIGATRVGQTSTYSALRYLDQKSFSLTDSGYNSPPTCKFDIICLDSEPQPRSGELVVIAVGTLQRRLFGGYLQPVTESRRLAASGRSVYRCQAVGFSQQLRDPKVFASYASASAGAILREQIAAHAPLYDASEATVADGPTLTNQVYDGDSLLDVCNLLASQCDYLFRVDAFRRVIFRAQDTEDAPWTLTDTTAHSIELGEDNSDVKTSIIVRYSEPERRTQSFIGNGEQEEFPLYGTLSEVHSLAVEGAAVSYGWRYTEDNSEHDFSIRGDNPAYIATMQHAVLAPGERLTIDYTALFEARVTVQSRAGIVAQQCLTGGSGVRSEVIEARDLYLADAVALAQTRLQQVADNAQSATYQRLLSLAEVVAESLQVGQQQAVQVHNYDCALPVQRITYTVTRPAADLSALLTLKVSLGSRDYELSDIIKDVTTAADVPTNERASTVIID